MDRSFIMENKNENHSHLFQSIRLNNKEELA